MNQAVAGAQLVPLTAAGTGHFRLEGPISFATVPGLLEKSVAAFAGLAELDVDLAGVSHADSAGLALLLLWLERAKRAGQSIAYHNAPEQLVGIARISDVEKLLGAAAS